MKARSIFISLLVITGMIAFSQRPTMELTFTAVDNTTHVQLDSIKIMNRTQGGDTVLYWPDTVLVLDYQVGILQLPISDGGFQVYTNYPNPVNDQTTISLYIPEKDQVNLIITDILGRIILRSDMVIDKGKHTFQFVPGNGNLYFFIASWQGRINSIKILNLPTGNHAVSLEYLGGEPLSPVIKVSEDVKEFWFSPGDELLYIGYKDDIQDSIIDTPENSKLYTFQFATYTPCLETPTVTYEGQIYNTVQIFSQCWLRENLNVGIMIPGAQNMSNNDMIEKYCYNDDSVNCITYGGLYQWVEIMQYTSTQGAQGICPIGWHIPSDEELTALTTYFGGEDIAGGPMKEAGTTHWNPPNSGATNSSGFTALPGGIRDMDGSFKSLGRQGDFWTSTTYGVPYAWIRRLYNDITNAYPAPMDKDTYGFSLRCVLDE